MAVTIATAGNRRRGVAYHLLLCSVRNALSASHAAGRALNLSLDLGSCMQEK
jgi:hypothetical protein